MSPRRADKRRSRPPRTAAVKPPTVAAPPADLWRRLLLVLMTALLVARPLLPGEDPGMLSVLTDSSGLVLVLLWFVALVLWALWVLSPGGQVLRIGWVQGALLAVIVVQFVSAGLAAAYHHPAWLVAWEWSALGIVLFLVHQMARDRRLLLAVVLATGTTVAAYGIYQSQVEIPNLRKQLGERIGLLEKGLDKIDLEESPRLRKQVEDRILRGHAFATFAHPNSFAGYLVLLLPLVVGAALVTGRVNGGATNGPRAALLFIALVLAAAIWLSHSRGAMLALAVVGLLTAACSCRRWLARHWLWAVAGVAALLVAAGLAYRAKLFAATLGKDPEAVRIRLEYWQATWAMIVDHPWLGVGPGNFGRHYPAYLPLAPWASEMIRDPHQFALEMWATSGVFAMAALLLALGAFLASSARFVLASKNRDVPDHGPESSVALFCVGGGLGLLLAGVARANVDPVVLILWVLVWFSAFWLFQRVLQGGAWMVAAGLAGVAGLLLHLLVSGGIGSPAVAQPLWAVIGIALGSLSCRKSLLPATLLRWAPLGLALLLAGVCFVLVVQPVIASRSQLASAASLKENSLGASNQERIGAYLRAARAATPGDSLPLIELAVWQWQAGPGPTWRENCALALETYEAARRLDPRNRQLADRQFKAYLEMARAVDKERRELLLPSNATATKPARRDRLTQLEREREEYLTRGREKLDDLVRINPTAQARGHFELAGAFIDLEDSRARRHAQTAWRLHHEAASPVYRLSASQLEQLSRWLDP